ncbi:hypothetical protein GUJ93_ZPchr0001g31311 [Zizania palustris]|uniref:Uncharacterized protein n=1 Tax=Zizania palustris TaxID=103762 RepID=A0A8J5VLN1_ZIZPA|nr:hypothetical protein GUJ93_ZPchr0001g31311 [Zizania palustris]
MSLPVPNVQELARACHGTDGEIPDRYVRPEVAADEAIGGRDINSAIPVIDLAKLLDPQSSQEECQAGICLSALGLLPAYQPWGAWRDLHTIDENVESVHADEIDEEVVAQVAYEA